MGIKPIATVSTPPAGTTTIISFIKEDNKVGNTEVDLSSFYKGFLVNGDIDRKTLEVTNLQERPIFAQAFLKAFKKSSITPCAKAMKTAWVPIINLREAAIWAVQDLWRAHCSIVASWPTLKMP